MKRHALAACLAALVVAGGPTLASAKEAPPPAAAPRPFTLPASTTYSLPNGAQVTLVPFGRVPKVSILASVRTGNLNEGSATWLADLTSATMEKGAAGKNASQIAQDAASMGGSFSISTGADLTSARMDVLSESAGDAIALIADILQRPDFPPEEFEKARADLLRSLSVARSSPGSIASESFASVIYPGHPFGKVLPTQDQLAGYSLDDVKAYYDTNFGAARTHIYIVGSFDQAKVRDAIEASFGGWKQGYGTLDLPSQPNAEPKVVLIDRPGAPQSTIRIGKRITPIRGDIDFMAANTLLGGYFSSRITLNIREDKGYTYSPRSVIENRPEGAAWVENADITAEATGPAITEIFKEIRRMQDSPPSDTEVQGIKNYMNGNFVMGLSSRGGVASNLASIDLLGLGPDYLDSYVGRIAALTPADFQQQVTRELPVDSMSVVVVGPLESVRAQLEAVPELSPRLPR